MQGVQKPFRQTNLAFALRIEWYLKVWKTKTLMKLLKLLKAIQ